MRGENVVRSAMSGIMAGRPGTVARGGEAMMLPVLKEPL
jgi:hypothetical protein